MFQKGQRVRHPGMPEWGLGEVLENSCGEKVTVFFVDAGSKILGLQYVSPERIKGDAAKSVFLDNLVAGAKQGSHKHQPLPVALTRFKKLFPLGFYDERYAVEERDYKVSAHKLMLDLLDQSQFQQLLERQAYAEVCKRALQVVNKTNLIFPNEKMSLKDGLKTADNQQRFARDLFALLYSDAAYKHRLEQFIDTLTEIGANKWTTLTYFPFIRFPEEHIFLKPAVTQKAASILHFELNYKSELNWTTYKCLLTLAHEIKERLIDLKPRDMIDIQSFIWCIDPDTYGPI
jgi:hypothetical protein